MEIRKARHWYSRLFLRGLVWPLVWAKALRGGPTPPRPAQPERIALFVSMELLGGGTIISAMAKTLRQLYPKAHICVVGERHRSGKLESFLTQHSWVDEIFYCPPRGKSSAREWWRFYRALRARNFDFCVLSPNHSCANSVFLYLCGIPSRLGAHLPLTWPWHGYVEHRFLTEQLTTDHIGEEPYRLLYFPQAYARALTGRMDMRLADLIPYVRFTDEGLPPGASNRPVVTMHPGGPETKRWPASGYITIGRRLVEHYDAAIFLIGGPPEAALSDEIRAGILAGQTGAQVFNVCGEPMNRTLTCIAHSATYIGNNAGPVHLAVALGTPVVGIYPQRDRWFSGPDGESDRHCVITRDRAQDVPPDDVWDAIVRRWRGAPVAMTAR